MPAPSKPPDLCWWSRDVFTPPLYHSPPMRDMQRTTDSLVQPFALSTGWHEAMGKLQTSPHLTARQRTVLNDQRRPDAEKMPKVLQHVVDIASEHPSLAMALAPARAMERAILAQHRTTLVVDLPEAHVGEERANCAANIAAAEMWPALHGGTVDAYIDALEQQEVATVVARFAAIRKRAQLASRRLTLSLTR